MSWLSRIAGGVLAGMLLSISVSFAEDKAASDYAVSVDPMVKVRMHDNLRKKLGGNDDLRSLCSGLKICMNQVFEGCFEDDMKPWPKVKYDDEFCKPYKELANRGYKADPKAPMVPEIYARLGRQYRVEYTYAGTLPLDENGEAAQDAEILLFRYSEDENGEPGLENIEDDDEEQTVL